MISMVHIDGRHHQQSFHCGCVTLETSSKQRRVSFLVLLGYLGILATERAWGSLLRLRALDVAQTSTTQKMPTSCFPRIAFSAFVRVETNKTLIGVVVLFSSGSRLQISIDPGQPCHSTFVLDPSACDHPSLVCLLRCPWLLTIHQLLLSDRFLQPKTMRSIQTYTLLH